jgi:hypothetical protein
MDYASKWIEAIVTPGKVVLNFLQKNIFTRFGTPGAITSDEGTHFATSSLKHCYLSIELDTREH